MKSVDEADAKVRLDDILEEAQRQPILIRRQGRDQAVVVSPAMRSTRSPGPRTRPKEPVALRGPAAERAGLGRVTWHQFRHIHSSLPNGLRVPVKIAQEQLGHASIQTTLNIYTHVDASHRAAIEQLER